MSDVELSVADAVAVVRLNRPHHGNALSNAVKSGLLDALRKVTDDASVRAVVLTGAGPAFTVGQDLGELQQALAANPETTGRRPPRGEWEP